MFLHQVEVLDKIIELRIRRPEETACLFPEAGEAHVVIDAVHLPEWRNDSGSFGVRYEKDGDELRRVVLERRHFRGAFTSTARGFAGEFTVGGRGTVLFEGLMSFGLSLLCEARGDLLLHTSAVVQNGRACLFLGPGGAGKTTIATELNGDRETFCVDKALVTTRPDGALRVHSTPFGDGFDGPKRPESAAIAGLCFIEQAEEHEVVPISRWEATNRLLGQAIADSREPSTVQRTMGMIGRLADLDAAYRLRFRRDAGFWPLIEAALPKGC